MAVTLHFCAEDENDDLVIRTRLGAFQHVVGRHTGKNLARHFVEILEELGTLHKIDVITMDNGSNCSTMMDDLEEILREKGVRFHCMGNRIQCASRMWSISQSSMRSAYLVVLQGRATEVPLTVVIQATWELLDKVLTPVRTMWTRRSGGKILGEEDEGRTETGLRSSE
ncbi:hypothetical protein FKP32DRAFT_1606311 [Trametes sanguinea]|nr:hypothetical protein FKP32DRAFT_1606311 [Trametes sanguinea]